MIDKVVRKNDQGKEYSLTDMKDHARNSLLLNDFSLASVTGALERLSYLIGTLNVEHIDKGENRYHGIHVTGKNGLNFEVQLTTKEHQRIKHEDDAIYKNTRNIKASELSEAEMHEYEAEVARGEKFLESV